VGITFGARGADSPALDVERSMVPVCRAARLSLDSPPPAYSSHEERPRIST
jgi:hypothetical protein